MYGLIDDHSQGEPERLLNTEYPVPQNETAHVDGPWIECLMRGNCCLQDGVPSNMLFSLCPWSQTPTQKTKWKTRSPQEQNADLKGPNAPRAFSKAQSLEPHRYGERVQKGHQEQHEPHAHTKQKSLLQGRFCQVVNYNLTKDKKHHRQADAQQWSKAKSANKGCLSQNMKSQGRSCK